MSSTLTKLMDELSSGKLKIVDLTQPLGPATPVIGLPPMFAPSPGVSIDLISRYDEKGPAWYWNTLSCGEHTGTHFDAPVHWVTGRDLPHNTCDTISPRRFIGAACVIDVTVDVAHNPDFLLMPERLAAWEREHGMIKPGSWVLLQTGWSKKTDPAAFLGLSSRGAPDGPHSPGFDAATSRILALERHVLGVGVETIGTDAGQAATFTPPFPNHAIMHGAGRFGLASLCNLDQLPPTGAVVIAAPLKIVGGSGSPLRAIAIVPG